MAIDIKPVDDEDEVDEVLIAPNNVNQVRNIAQCLSEGV